MAEVDTSRAHRQAVLWTGIGYTLMVIITIAGFLIIRAYGETLDAVDGATSPSTVQSTAKPTDVLLRVLIALAAVIVVGQVLARVFAAVGQPPVIGEVVAGILLGPSLLGEEVSALILPASVAPFLGLIAQLGVILYMFL